MLSQCVAELCRGWVVSAGGWVLSQCVAELCKGRVVSVSVARTGKDCKPAVCPWAAELGRGRVVSVCVCVFPK